VGLLRKATVDGERPSDLGRKTQFHKEGCG
jgi:hypothetical protein